MRNIIVFVVVGLSLILVSVSVLADEAGQATSQEVKGIQKPVLSGKLENGIRVIEVKASKFKFDPDPIVVKLGEKVRLVVTSMDVEHGIAIAEMGVNLPVPAQQTRSVDFTANDASEMKRFFLRSRKSTLSQ